MTDLTIPDYINSFIDFTNSTLIPLLIGIALLFFLINMVRYFIIGDTNEQARTKAKNHGFYGIIALTFLIAFWGIANLIANSLQIETGADPMKSDYIKE